MEAKSKVRYAVVGAGNITQVAVLPAFAHARENSELVGLISGDPEKRVQLGRRYDVPFVGDHHDFEVLLDQARVDAVYAVARRQAKRFKVQCAT